MTDIGSKQPFERPGPNGGVFTGRTLPNGKPEQIPGANPDPQRVAGDRAAIAPRAKEITPAPKRALASYTPEAGEPGVDEHASDLPAPTLALKASDLCGPAPHPRADRPDFAIKATWEAGTGETRSTRVAVKANAQGDTVTVGPGGAIELNGKPLALAEEEPTPLPGGGSVTAWGQGYFTVSSAAGDNVSIFSRDALVDFFAGLVPAGDPRK